MKKHIMEFFRRGLVACGIGPIILAIVYLILRQSTDVETLTVTQVCTGILSTAALALIAGGMNFLYQMERLPLMAAILIHGAVLYVSYLGTYLVNGWLEQGYLPFLIFSAVFAVGYLVIWAIIYSVMRRKTAHLNEILRKQRQESSNGWDT